MIDALIFSKDRACQLDLLLRTIKKNFSELRSGNIYILWKATNEDYEKAYEILQSKHSGYNWIKEQNFTQDVKTIVNKFTQPYSLAFVDDEVIVDNFSILESLKSFSVSKDLHTISLRMWPGIDYTYTSNVHQGPIDKWVYKGKEVFIWNWRDYDTQSQTGLPCESGYPSCINSHIYPTEMFKEYVVNKLNFHNANALEGTLNNHRHEFKPLMMCFKSPKTVSIANNLTQTGTNRYNQSGQFTCEELNNKFLDGYIIDESPFLGLKKNTPTFEYPYTFKKET